MLETILGIYWNWYYTITLIGTGIISFLAGYYERKNTVMNNKGVRFYKPKDNLCAVWDDKEKTSFQFYSVDEATKILKLLNTLYYKEEISHAERERPTHKIET